MGDGFAGAGSARPVQAEGPQSQFKRTRTLTWACRRRVRHLDRPMPLQMRTCLPHALARWEVGLRGLQVPARCKQKALSLNLSAHAQEHERVDEWCGHLDPPMPLQMRTCLPHALARWGVGLRGLEVPARCKQKALSHNLSAHAP